MLARIIVLAVILPLASPFCWANDSKKDPTRSVTANRQKCEFLLARKGEQTDGAGSRRPRVSTDPVVAEYVNRLGQNLVRNSDAKMPFTIKVLDTDEVNAFALSGGFFFVNSGLILEPATSGVPSWRLPAFPSCRCRWPRDSCPIIILNPRPRLP
jgi:predicted Zn-dependent protease